MKACRLIDANVAPIDREPEAIIVFGTIRCHPLPLLGHGRQCACCLHQTVLPNDISTPKVRADSSYTCLEIQTLRSQTETD